MTERRITEEDLALLKAKNYGDAPKESWVVFFATMDNVMGYTEFGLANVWKFINDGKYHESCKELARVIHDYVGGMTEYWVMKDE